MNIRKFELSANTLDELVMLGTVTDQAARFLEAAIVIGLNVHPLPSPTLSHQAQHSVAEQPRAQLPPTASSMAVRALSGCPNNTRRLGPSQGPPRSLIVLLSGLSM